MPSFDSIIALIVSGQSTKERIAQLKTDLTKEDAARYKDFFDRSGCIANIEPILDIATQPTVEAHIICPKCAASQVKSVQCIKCGVIFEKLKSNPPSIEQVDVIHRKNETEGWKKTVSNKRWQILAISLALLCWVGFYSHSATSAKQKSEKPASIEIPYTSGDGPSSKEPFTEFVKKLFEDGKFAELDVIVDEIRTRKSRFQDGGWKLVYFYYSFDLTGNYPQWVFTNKIALAEKWRKSNPESVTAQVVLAQAWYNYAWHERGDGYANGVKKDAWPIVNERLDKAWKIVNERLPSGVADCPERLHLRLILANAMGIDREKFEAYFQEAIRLEPNYYVFYYTKAEFLYPRWHGQEGEWQQFIREVAQKNSTAEGATIYTRTAISKLGLWENFNDDGISWDLMKAGFIEMEKNYPDSTFILNWFARFACLAGDHNTLPPLLKRIGTSNYNPDAWGEMNIDRCRDL